MNNLNPDKVMDFTKICRICLNEGVMMSIFKVNISKKMMACASVQVWQNDGLPPQICNKCSAKLHISFQFKKQCEKADLKLRQYLLNLPEPNQDTNPDDAEMLPEDTNQQMQPQQKLDIDLNAPTLQPPSEQQQNCVYIECAPLLEISHEQKFDAYLATPQPPQAPPLTPINYNIQPQNHLQINGYNIQNVGQVQVYNGAAYAMPIQTMQPNIIHNQVLTSQMQVQPQISQLTQPILQQAIPPDDKDSKAYLKIEKTEAKIASAGKQCPTCGKYFATTTKLTRHLKTHSTDLPYKCKVCYKAFSHSGNYKIHLRMHTDERPFRCKVCDKGCRQAQDLEKHMRTHTGERPHKCNICPRAFSTSSNLIAHIRTHTGERPYVCCVCQKAFCQSNELTKHMRTHTGEKSHICDICHKGFNGSSTLIVHRRSHTGERPYICNVCNKGFSQSSCLAVHMKRHFNERNFSCTQCNRSFVTNADLKEHSSIHKEKFNCTTCNKSFNKLNDLNKHLKTHIAPDES